MIFTASLAMKDHAFSQKPWGSAAVLLRPATRRTFSPPFTMGSETSLDRSGSSLHAGNCWRIKSMIPKGIACGLMPEVILPALVDPLRFIGMFSTPALANRQAFHLRRE